jgi:hypothetical protein
MAFDLATAKPAAPAKGGFDLASARPVGAPAAEIPVSAAERAFAARQASPQEAPQDNLLGKAFGVLEAPLAMASGIVGGAVGSVAGVGKSLVGGHYGTQQGVREGEQLAGRVANALTYQPRTQTGGAIVQQAGEKLADSGIVGIPIPELNALARGAGSSMQAIRGLAGPSAAAQGAADAAVAANPQPWRNLLAKPAPAMAGGGAASTAEEALRAQRFAQFGIKPTKGQLTRTMEDVGFEREAAKTPEGKAIDARYADQNARVQSLFNEFGEQTGAQAASLRATGKSVVNAVEAKQQAKEAGIRAQYAQARAAGEMAAPVDVTALAEWVAKNKGKDKLAPIVSTIESELKQNAKTEGGGYDPLTLGQRPSRTVMTLDASEDLRQAINKLAEPGTPNVVFGKEAKALIDSAQEGKGGALFKQARRAYENYAKEFADRDVVDKLLRTKPGTKDRAVAFEDVMKHSILDGSLDDTRHLFRVLEAHEAGTDPAIVAAGQQAAKDLRGALTEHIKEKMFGNAGADTAGNVIGSQAKIKAIINELDADGKLTAIYGKQGAQTLRDVRDLAVDLYTTPPGSVNYSNTATKMVAALDKLSSRTNAIPVVGPVLGPAAKYVAKRAASNALSKKVDAALNPAQNALAQPPNR